jgi:zinc transporter
VLQAKSPDIDLRAGMEAGLRFATLVTPTGGFADLRWRDIETWRPSDGFLWIHLERDDPVAQTWLRERSGIDPLVALALVAEESRPRVQDVDDGLMVVLRGVNVADDPMEAELVPIHVWMEPFRCVSLRDKDHQLSALRDIRLLHMNKRGPRTAGFLMAVIAEKVVDHLGVVIEGIETEVSELEDRVVAGVAIDSDYRIDIARARRRAIELRRYLGPQRDALYKLEHDDAPWLEVDAKRRLREVTDRLVRDIEDLDELRDRATVLHEDLSAQISERIAKTSNRLTSVAAMLLPPTLITGLLGTNIGGIPGAQSDNAFAILCGLLVALVPVNWVVLKLLKWL